MDVDYLKLLRNKSFFNTEEFYKVFSRCGSDLGNEAIRKRLQQYVKNGDIIRVGRGLYSVPEKEQAQYDYQYSEFADSVAEKIIENHPYLEFAIFELIQLNEFVNHQLAHNVVFLSVEDELEAFVFDTLKEEYPGKVLLNPTVELYHQYWYDDMIVVGKLITEAPKGVRQTWHTRIEKMLVDMVADILLMECISAGEYPEVFTEAFRKYAIDESCLFRYAKRRNAEKKIKKLIKEKTEIQLRIKG